MRKTILTTAAACLLMVVGLSATENSKNYEMNSTETLIGMELSTFCKAIMKGDVATVKKLIDLGEDINQKSLGMAPIHFAARYNKPEILEILIDNGADLKRKCDKGYSAKKHAELSNATEALAVINKAMNR